MGNKATKKVAKHFIDFIERNVNSYAPILNSLTAIDGHDREYFNELRARVVSPQIFVRLQSLIAR